MGRFKVRFLVEILGSLKSPGILAKLTGEPHGRDFAKARQIKNGK
jgi:hypothetical protein